MTKPEIVIVGGGVFGLTAAIELAAREHTVAVFEQGLIPHPLAAGTDISKVVRMEYGSDDEYMKLGILARKGWLEWNEGWEREGLAPLYHDSGVLMCSREVMAEQGFEADSFRLLEKNGQAPERMSPDIIESRYPAWNPDYFQDGFFNPHGGFVESGAVVKRLCEMARRAGVTVNENVTVEKIIRDRGGAAGISTAQGDVATKRIVVAAGGWGSKLCPSLKTNIRSTGHPVFHFRPDSPELFTEELFPTFTADVARTGYYGFPLSSEGVVKIGKHSLGMETDPDGVREIPREQYELVRAFLSDALPVLADAELVYSRLCLYADTPDDDFWIDEDPECSGLFVAGGGSGHGFKFAPALGSLIADIIEGKDHPLRRKFEWRSQTTAHDTREAARYHETI